MFALVYRPAIEASKRRINDLYCQVLHLRGINHDLQEYGDGQSAKCELVMAELHRARQEQKALQEELDRTKKALASLRAKNTRAAAKRNERGKEKRA